MRTLFCGLGNVRVEKPTQLTVKIRQNKLLQLINTVPAVSSGFMHTGIQHRCELRVLLIPLRMKVASSVNNTVLRLSEDKSPF